MPQSIIPTCTSHGKTTHHPAVTKLKRCATSQAPSYKLSKKACEMSGRAQPARAMCGNSVKVHGAARHSTRSPQGLSGLAHASRQ